MIERRYGKIVMTSSRDGLRAEANYAHYNASKFGVIGYVKSLAIELGPYEINVNAICPRQMADTQPKPLDSAVRPARTGTRSSGRRTSTYEEFDQASAARTCSRSGGQTDFSGGRGGRALARLRPLAPRHGPRAPRRRAAGSQSGAVSGDGHRRTRLA